MIRSEMNKTESDLVFLGGNDAGGEGLVLTDRLLKVQCSAQLLGFLSGDRR
jgi:hypothetical protein